MEGILRSKIMPWSKGISTPRAEETNRIIEDIKAVLEMEGIDFGDCRRPFGALGEEEKAQLRQGYDRYIGLL